MYKNKETTACFTGHRPQDLPFTESESDEKYVRYRKLLKLKIAELYSNYGVRTFISGMAVGVDTIAAEAVIEMRKRLKDMKLVCAIPCREQSSMWGEGEQKRYSEILEAADDAVVLSEHYTETCMAERNRYMINRSAYCIATWSGSTGGTSLTVGMARQAGLRLFIIDPQGPEEIAFEDSYAYPGKAPEDLFTPETKDEPAKKIMPREKELFYLGRLKGKRF